MPGTTDAHVPSDTVLDEIPARALRFFGAVSSNSYIRATLNTRGYSDEIHERAWRLICAAAGFRPTPGKALMKPEAASAIAELDGWDEPNFRVARAALLETPEQLAFVFEGLEAQRGAASVTSVTTFLDRLDELESGKDRKATRKADQAALDKLAARRIGPEERERLRGLLAIAKASPAAEDLVPDPKKTEKDDAKKAEQRQAKIELWRLYAEWSEVAKADIKRRDHLIQLGLAKRKAKKKGEEAAGEGEGGEK